MSVVAIVLSNAKHIHYARHIFAHWHKGFESDGRIIYFGELQKHMVENNEALNELAALDTEVVDGFKSYNPKVFCGAFMDTYTKVGVVDNNLAESFNG